MNMEYISGPQCHVGCKAGKRARLQDQWGQNDRCEGSRSGTSSKPGIKDPPSASGRKAPPWPPMSSSFINTLVCGKQSLGTAALNSGYQGRVIHSLIRAGWGLLNCVVVN